MHGPPGLFFVLDKAHMSERMEEERGNYHLGTQEQQQLPFLRQYHPLEVEDLFLIAAIFQASQKNNQAAKE